jgi:hypothetical protein
MVLAEQGHQVVKWSTDDPIHDLNRGAELWGWLNTGKRVEYRHASELGAEDIAGKFGIVIDNFRAATWEKWGIDPAVIAERAAATWVSLRADDDGRSFDVIAQARAWGDCGILPFYLGDTAAGLWMAFKALAAPRGHHVIGQATCLAKLVEGEGVAPRERDEPWDEPGTYGVTDGHATVMFKDELVVEPMRDLEWRLANLPHKGGRFRV